MKSDRLLAMLLLLQAKGRASARQIAKSLEVSERTIYRDIDSLSAAGIPVHAERGSGGGIVLAEGYRRALTQFRDEEIRALFASAADALVDVGLGDNLRHALDKLTGAMTDSQRRAALETRTRIHIDSRRWRQAAQPREILATLRRAATEDLTTVLQYRDRNGKVSERSIDPLGLVAKAGVWYLVARYGDEMRTFRADRVLSLDVTAQRFERPRGFDLDEYWREWSDRFERGLPGYPVVLSVAPAAFEDVTAYWDAEIVEDAPRRGRRGWRTVKVIFPSLGTAVSHIVMWCKQVDPIEPAEVRTEALARAKDVMKAFGPG
jgi:predicted DNA-binding transcriptional regulator YafY